MADREAFDAYVRERWMPLLRTATLLTGDRHAAEDLVQETLVRAAAAAPALPLLAGVTRNTFGRASTRGRVGVRLPG